jgi:hypothetical protein
MILFRSTLTPGPSSIKGEGRKREVGCHAHGFAWACSLTRMPAHSSRHATRNTCGPVGDATGLLGVGLRDGHEIRRDTRHSALKRISEVFMSGEELSVAPRGVWSGW